MQPPTPSPPEPIEEADFAATAHFDGARLVLQLRGQADQRTGVRLGTFFDAADTAAVAASSKEMVVDFRACAFMNSSGLKAVVTWLVRAKNHPPDRRYTIRFLHAPELHWQIRSFTALQACGGGLVAID
jgi:hypothetical protein